MDPNGFGAGDKNLYRDVANDPTSALDPSGLQKWYWDFASFGVVPVIEYFSARSDSGKLDEKVKVVQDKVHEMELGDALMRAPPPNSTIGQSWNHYIPGFRQDREEAIDLSIKVAKIGEIGSGIVAATAVTIPGGGTVTFEGHAVERMAERGVTVTQAESALKNGTSFKYYHDGIWKVGYYDSTAKVFVGTVEGRATTVITNVKPGYIDNLKAAKP